ncbi:hypothetical protein [Phyllobacterium myrsinacearum]|uniref:Uncharacterized protein n=1 Tax=Phyllobacterium myrsinacearum TaxID=28101 RepID=A0A839EUA2_9HYPH|nr:hypothetical protein [Phyllobacterium myrsinacearum]MBA8881685.1 hypothetical protein [Phyllobacterium myrsinacearum]
MPRKNSKNTPAVETVTVEEESVLVQALAEIESDTIEASAETAEPDVKPTYQTIFETFAQDEASINQTRIEVANAFDERSAFQKAKNPDNENIQKTLAKGRAKMIEGAKVAGLLSSGISSGFINRSVSDGERFNVYAVDKMIDIINALNTGSELSNAINNAICRSLFRFKNAGEKFTTEMALGATSDKIRIQGTLHKMLVRHTVSANTAPTQKSSTIVALETLGIIRNAGTGKAAIYEVLDTPQARRLEEVLMAA